VEIAATDEKDAKEKLLAIVSRYGRVEGQGLYEFLDGTGIDLEQWAVPDLPDLDLDSWLDEFMRDPEVPQGDPDAVPEVQAEAVTQPGDLWLLGKHKIVCGDCTVEALGSRLFGGIDVDLICTDPPYCSGGFQEVGKSSGSVGTSAAHKSVANDKLSTRGYTALLKTAITAIPASYAYVFTDWRMWVYLYDIVESSGYGVRSMITWNKGTPGMGKGWRAQHELIMWGTKQVPPYDKRWPGAGNVITLPRTGNNLHTTEKPVDLIAQLLQNAPFGKVVADPFAGSGTTLIACEGEGRTFLGAELDSLYVDVIVKRWQDYTGKEATLESDGRTFNEMGAERGVELEVV
jgi:DNA modification methylase